SHIRQGLRYLHDESRLVALPADALRRQKGRIGFYENLVERQRGRCIAQMRHLWICDVRRKRNHEAHVHSLLGFSERSRETVKNSAKAARTPVLLENFQAIGPRIAAMNNDGQLRGTRQL